MGFTSTFHAFQDGIIFTVALGLLLVFLLQHSDLPVKLRWIETEAPFKEAPSWQKEREMNSYWTMALATFEKAVQDLKEANKSDEDEEVEEVEFNLSRLSHLDENPSVYRDLKEGIEIQVKKLEGEIRRDLGGDSQLVGDETGQLDDGYDADVESALRSGDEHDKADINEAEAEQTDSNTQNPIHHDPTAEDLYLATVRLNNRKQHYTTALTSIQNSLDQATRQHKLKLATYSIFPGLLDHEREREDLTFNVADLVHQDLNAVSHNLSLMLEEKRTDAEVSIGRMDEVERRAEILARLDREERVKGEILDPVREPRPCGGEEEEEEEEEEDQVAGRKFSRKSVWDCFFGRLRGTGEEAIVLISQEIVGGRGGAYFRNG